MKKYLFYIFLLVSFLANEGNLVYAQPSGNRGMYFDGVNDYVNAGTSISNTINSAISKKPFSISTWVKLSSLVGDHVLLTSWEEGNGASLFRFGVLNGQPYLKEVNGLYNTNGVSLEVNKWTHVTVTYDLDSLNWYHNGVSVSTNGKANLYNGSGVPVRMGTDGVEFFRGQIDDMKVFNKMLTSSEVVTQMNSTPLSPNCISYWNFEDDAGGVNSVKVTNIVTSESAVPMNGPLWALRVTETGDNVDVQGTLRWAIEEANKDTDKDYIDFSIQQTSSTVVSTITPTAELTVIQPIIIDGYSAYGSSPNTAPFLSPNNAKLRVQCDFSNIPAYDGGAGPYYHGMTFTNTSNSVARGLSLYSIQEIGHSQFNFNFKNTTGSVLEGSYIGLKADGNKPTARSVVGVGIDATSSSNIVGGDSVWAYNIISDCFYDGFQISGAGSIIKGNYIGTDISGNNSLPNGYRGIAINNSSNNSILKNLISGNGTNGITVQMGAIGTVVKGNYIGIKANKSGGLANGANGIRIETGAVNSVIGGTGANEPNIIAYNTASGVSIDGNATVDHKVSGNSIFCNTTSGIALSSLGNKNKVAPVISTANTSVVSGTCSAANDIVEIFKDTIPSCGGVNQGKKYMGTAITTGTSWSYSGTFAGGDKITATAYEAGKGTSPFSAVKLVECTAENGLVNFDDNSLAGFTATTGLLTPTVTGGQMKLDYAISNIQLYSNFLIYTSPCLIDMSETDSAWVKLKVTTNKAVTIRVVLMDNAGYYTDYIMNISSFTKNLPANASAQEVAINFASLFQSSYMDGGIPCTPVAPCPVNSKQIKAVLISINTATSGSLIIDNIQIGVPAVSVPTATAATSVTKNSFQANWTKTGATSYDLDVSTIKDFSTSLTGYPKNNLLNLYAGVSGLAANTVYYYRVRETGSTSWSNTKMTSTIMPSGSGNVLTFNGVSNYVEIGTDKDFDFVSSSSFTVEAWVKLDATAVGKNVIYSKRSQIPPFNGFAIALDVVSGVVDLNVDCDNSTAGRTISGFKFNEWYHIAVVFSANAYTVYINGVTHMYSPSNIIVSTADKPRIGAYYNNANFFKGQIDEVRIWGKELTLADIQSNMCQKLTGSEPQLIGYFRIDENKGIDTENKANGSTIDGTIVGSTTWQYSGAPIGDVSQYQYNTGNNLSLSDTDKLTIDNYSLATNQGIHVYKVNEAPSQTGKEVGLDSLRLKSYFGVFPIGITSYRVTYDYSTSSLSGKPQENSFTFANRKDNSLVIWNKIANTTLDMTTQIVATPTTPLLSGQNEVIGAFAPPPTQGAALGFDGVYDIVTVANGSAIFANKAAITMEGWAKINGSGIQGLFGIRAANDAAPAFWIAGMGNGSVQYRAKTDEGVIGNTFSLPTNPNGWHHYALVYDGDSSIFYVDGQLIQKQVLTGSFTNSTLPFYLGYNEFSGPSNWYLNGQLDEVRIWNRALCQVEILNNMKCDNISNKSNLVAQYSFNQGIAFGDNSNPTVNVAVDSSGNNNNGTLTGFDLKNASSNWIAPYGAIKSDSVCTPLTLPTGSIWTWTGTESKDWFSPCNWDRFSVPSITSVVNIPGTTKNQPTIAGATTAKCKTITINTMNGAMLTIDKTSGATLEVNP